MPLNYTVTQVNDILNAYQRLFPNTEGALARYWDYEQTRPWSCLTTDFHTVSLETIQAFDAAVREINDTELSPQTLGQQFKNLSRQHNVGYSLGISPWTDDLLLRTFSEKTSSVIIVLGHDWYPIVANARDGRIVRPRPPLQQYSVFDDPGYKDALPHSLCTLQNCAILFMNLYPDFRPPGSAKTGDLGNYDQWVTGLEAVCKSILQQYRLIRVISWGGHVWEALRSKVGADWQQLRIMAAVDRQYQDGKCAPLTLHLEGMEIPYNAFAHPSFAPCFKNKMHWTTYQSALQTLILSLQ